MIGLTLDEVAAACGGRLEAGDPGALASGVVIDSRAVTPGDLFFGLRGESADGGAGAAPHGRGQGAEGAQRIVDHDARRPGA